MTTTELAPRVHRFATAPDPEAAVERLRDLPHLVWLDGGLERGPLARFSYLAADPVLVIRHAAGAPAVRRRGEPDWSPLPHDALAELHAQLQRFAMPAQPDLPPFQGGFMGWIGYGYGKALERLPDARFDDLGLADLLLGLYDWVLAWDHDAGTCSLVSIGLGAGIHGDDDRDAEAARRLQMVLARLEGPVLPLRETAGAPTTGQRPPAYPVVGIEHAETLGLRSTFTHRGFMDAVERVRAYIRAGDIFQANLSQRFEAPLHEPAWALYRRLRRANPAAFSAWIEADGVQVLSASPERFLSLDGGRVETRPIKGTIGRGVGPMHDLALGRALLESEKDRAENVMIVDLLRNDLSRVCGPGSVRVPSLCALERHPTVHHLVSTVTGELAPGCTAADLLRATFPGGSITGAPKIRAMEIIAELEPTERGLYCGSIGWFGLDGAMDTSIVIRTFVARDGRVTFSAGGGIVLDSDPAREYDETVHKARGLLRALAGGLA
jgi:para-aminobenzoate synthetase component 1